jgi:hypothetical protein
VAAELLDAAEQAIDVAGVLAQQPALEHQRVGGAGAVANFAETDNALVGVDLEQRRAERSAGDFGDADIGNPQLARVRRGADVGLDQFGGCGHGVLSPFAVCLAFVIFLAIFAYQTAQVVLQICACC